MRVVKANIQPIPNVPTNVDKALNRPNRSEQRKTFEEELNSYEVQKTQDLVKLLRSRKALLGRQVIVIKLNVNGLIARFKARWVVKGFRQIEGVNYDKTFSLVVKSITQRILLALGAKYNLYIEYVDIVTAFLELLLREEVYIKQPHGFVKNPNLVYQLLKALYGLKQVPRKQYLTLREFFKSLGFTRIQKDHSVFVYKNGTIIGIYVDDLFILTPVQELIDLLKKELAKRFRIKDLGEISFYLGIQIIRNRKNRSIYIN